MFDFFKNLHNIFCVSTFPRVPGSGLTAVKRTARGKGTCLMAPEGISSPRQFWGTWFSKSFSYLNHVCVIWNLDKFGLFCLLLYCLLMGWKSWRSPNIDTALQELFIDVPDETGRDCFFYFQSPGMPASLNKIMFFVRKVTVSEESTYTQTSNMFWNNDHYYIMNLLYGRRYWRL